MSDLILEQEPTLENQPKFEHYVAATQEIVERIPRRSCAAHR